MSNDHFGMPFVTSFCRIIWKIILQIFEEAHNYLYRDTGNGFYTLFMGVLFHVRVRPKYKLEKIAFEV